MITYSGKLQGLVLCFNWWCVNFEPHCFCHFKMVCCGWTFKVLLWHLFVARLTADSKSWIRAYIYMNLITLHVFLALLSAWLQVLSCVCLEDLLSFVSCLHQFLFICLGQRPHFVLFPILFDSSFPVKCTQCKIHFICVPYLWISLLHQVTLELNIKNWFYKVKIHSFLVHCCFLTN